MYMFKDLIDALKTQRLNLGESISLAKLCKAQGLSPHTWRERLDSAGIRMMIREDLEHAGFTVRPKAHGGRRGWVFELLECVD